MEVFRLYSIMSLVCGILGDFILFLNINSYFLYFSIIFMNFIIFKENSKLSEEKGKWYNSNFINSSIM